MLNVPSVPRLLSPHYFSSRAVGKRPIPSTSIATPVSTTTSAAIIFALLSACSAFEAGILTSKPDSTVRLTFDILRPDAKKDPRVIVHPNSQPNTDRRANIHAVFAVCESCEAKARIRVLPTHRRSESVCRCSWSPAFHA